MNLFSTLLIQQFRNQPAVIVQVGACDGKINDPIYEIVKYKIQTEAIVLIEPQHELIQILQDNYAFHANVKIANVAIGEKGTFSLYRLKKQFWDTLERTYLTDSPHWRVPSGFVSQSYEHVLNHIKGKISDSIMLSDAIEEIKVQFKTLSEVLQQFEIKKIDVLQIDVEGLDDEVIYHSDIASYKPKIINFEHKHLNFDKKTSLYQYLINQGYKIHEYSISDTLATLININSK